MRWTSPRLWSLDFPPSSSRAWRARKGVRAVSAMWPAARRRGGAGAAHPEPHVLLMLYAESGLATWRLADREPHTSARALRFLKHLQTTDMNGREPFGFTDGVSPAAAGLVGRTPARHDSADLEYGNLLASGEFLLGSSQRIWTLHRPAAAGPATSPGHMHCRSRRMMLHDATWAATAAIWCFASLHRMSEGSGASSRRRPPVRRRGLRSPRRWWGERCRGMRSLPTMRAAEFAGALGLDALDVRAQSVHLR